jgi:hypothetical protein
MIHGKSMAIEGDTSAIALHQGQLIAQHRALDEQIKDLQVVSRGTDPYLKILKFKKLILKDKIEGRRQ